MRALHLIKTGVGAVWALRQIKVLIGEGIDVHVAIGEDGPMADRYRAAGAKVHRLPIDIARIVRAGPGGYHSAMRQFRSLVLEIKPDIIHSHFIATTLFARLALGRSSRIPRIFQVPGPLHLEKTLPRLADLRTSSPCDYFIASCKLTREIYVRNGIPPERVYLSYYGTDVDDFAPITPDPTIRAALGVPNDAAVVGMVAFIYPPRRYIGQNTGVKGHEDLIEAIGLLRDAGRNVAGVFVGGAWGGADAYEARLRRIAEARLGQHGIFLGTRIDVPDLYKAFDVVVHPSHSENLGGAAESLLLAVPTIATQVGGFPDIVKHELTGLLAPPRAPQALAEAIDTFLNDLPGAQAMAIAGHELVRDLLDVQRTGREIAFIYQRVIDMMSDGHYLKGPSPLDV
jgi:glycosyltransferase involved in cell wall biosynthesis